MVLTVSMQKSCTIFLNHGVIFSHIKFSNFFAEEQALLHKFLEKTKKKSTKSKAADQSDSQTTEDQSQATTKEQEKLRKKVTQLMKKQRVKQVKGIVKAHDDSKPWGQESHVKVSFPTFLQQVLF